MNTPANDNDRLWTLIEGEAVAELQRLASNSVDCITCPSANFFNQYIGEDELTGLPLNKYSTLSYPIPAPMASVLQGSHPDCFFSIAVNANQTSTPPALDNLRFK